MPATPTLSPELDALLIALPKAELHIHLEGTIQPASVLTFARKYGADLGRKNEEEIGSLYRYRNFRDFLVIYKQLVSLLRQPEDFALVIEELGQSAARQNIRYLEINVSTRAHFRYGVPYDELLDGLAIGAEAARRVSGVEMRFILTYGRGHEPEPFQEIAEWCVRGREKGVVGLGLGGYEPGNPASLYSETIQWAQQHGVPFAPHAGETAGAENIWDTLRLKPARIEHGFRAVEDPQLVEHIRERRITLDICPTSNVCTNSISGLEAHPLRQLWEAGVQVTINSDNPSMFHTTLLDEYRLAVTHFGFTPAELAQMSLTAVHASLLPSQERSQLEARFQEEIERLGLAGHQ